jgi:cardiolipin synthase A/B
MLVPVNIVAISSAVTLVVHLLGIANAAHAVMTVRSSRGAIAWGISLITFPWLAIPLYWVFGRNKFHGYAEALHSAYIKHREAIAQSYDEIGQYRAAPPESLASLEKLAESFSDIPFTFGNAVELLLNAEPTYQAMLDAIAQAKSYVLLQSYTLRDDEAGERFKQAAIAKAKQGIPVYILYDGLGSKGLSRSYLKTLRQNGIRVNAFLSTKGKGNRFQLNFRNHRKILVVDGEIAFMGGLNIGDEYLGKKPPLSPWRDTHMRLRGPVVQCLQNSFLADWYWATGKVPEVNWQVKIARDRNQKIYLFPNGPADRLPACTLLFVNAINQAQNRLWIASPYFVPDDSVLAALKLAAIRGVDVRILLPDRADHLFVYLCSFSYYAEMLAVGVKLYRYEPGFMHQKVILVDRILAGVGTVNLDNRSFFLNFEMTAFVSDSDFINSVEQMLLDDLEVCRRVKLSEYDRKSFWFKLAVQVSRLLAPIL